MERAVLTKWKMKNNFNLPKQEIPRLLGLCLKKINNLKNLIWFLVLQATGIYLIHGMKVIQKMPPHLDTRNSSLNSETSRLNSFEKIMRKQRYPDTNSRAPAR